MATDTFYATVLFSWTLIVLGIHQHLVSEHFQGVLAVLGALNLLMTGMLFQIWVMVEDE